MVLLLVFGLLDQIPLPPHGPGACRLLCLTVLSSFVSLPFASLSINVLMKDQSKEEKEDQELKKITADV